MSDIAALAQILSAVAIVAVTLWYVLLTRGLLETARLGQAPQVVVEFATSNLYDLELIIANTGYRPAQELLFTFKSDVVDRHGDRLRDLGPFRHGIKYLAPGRQYRYRIEMGRGMVPEGPGEKVIDLEVSWGDGRTSHSDRIVLDLAIIDGMMFNTFADPMAGVVKALDKLSRPRDTFQKQLDIFAPGPSCGICREPVKTGARKCPHCGEWIGNGRPPDVGASEQ